MWYVIAQWEGDLKDIPLVGEVRDYAQVLPNLIHVVIRCTDSETPEQVRALLGDGLRRLEVERA